VRALGLYQAANNLRLVVRVFEDLSAVFRATAFGIVRAKDNPFKPEITERLGAHGAGLQRDGHIGFGQIITQLGHGGAGGEHFGVGGGIIPGFCLVVGGGKHGAVFQIDHGPDGDFACGDGGAGFIERAVHHAGVKILDGDHKISLRELLDVCKVSARLRIMNMTRPLIGISLDWLEKGSFSSRPHYALRQAYFDAVWAAGGLPVAIPLIEMASEDFLSRVEGVVIPGGDYPSPGWWYGDDKGDEAHPRACYDVKLVRACLAKNIPLFGICAGFQTMVVATGGRLHWRVKDVLKTQVPHRSVAAEKYAHSVHVAAGSALEKMVGALAFEVNSHHNEGVAALGENMRAVATAPDGLVEAVEVVNQPFALGVQWHPEFFTEETTADGKIWRAFVAAAAAYAAKKGEMA